MTLEPKAAAYAELAGLYIAALYAVQEAERFARALAASQDEGEESFGAQFVTFGRELQVAQAHVAHFIKLAEALGEPVPPDLVLACDRLRIAARGANDRAEHVLATARRSSA